MEDIAEGVLRAAMKGVVGLARALLWLSWELLCETILWYVGWPVARLLSLNRFPKEAITRSEDAELGTLLWVCGTGLVALLLLAFGLAEVLGA